MANSSVVLDQMSAGSLVATDNIGGTQHQLIKMEFGPEGAGTQVSQTNPLPVTSSGTITSGSIVVTAGTEIITSGSITVVAGTIGTVGAVGQIHNAGTIQGGTIGQITNGSIVVTAGTMALSSPGTITSGTVAINAGTIGGKAASGAAAVANPVQIAGTDSGGSIYSPLIDIAGAGTISGVGTLPGIGVVSNLTNGSIKITAGTTNAGTLDLVTTVTTVSNLTNGSIKVTAGTIADATVRVGTINSGTINAGTINSGTINAGTINSGTINAGTINAGTFSLNPIPTKLIATIGSVWGTSSGTAGTLVAAPTGGSAIYLNDISIVNEGTSTLTAGLSFGTNQQGTLVIARAAMAGNGGIEKPFPAANSGNGTQFPLVMWTTGSGTASFTASYFISL